MKSVAVVSLLTDQVSGSRTEVLHQAYPPATRVVWHTNDTLRKLVADAMRDQGRSVMDVPYQPPQPLPSTVPQHEAAMVQNIADALTQAAGTTPIDLILIIHPVELNRQGDSRAISDVGAVLTFSIVGAIAAATDEYRPGYLVLLPTGFEQAMGNSRNCIAGYRLYFVDARTREILSQTQDLVARGELDRAIWPPDYTSLPESDRQTLETVCLSGLGRSVVDHVVRMTGAH